MTGEDTNPMLQYILNNPEEFAKNLSEIAENGGKALAAYLEPREKGEAAMAGSEEMNAVVKTLAEVGNYWMKDPSRAIEAQTKLWSGYMGIWSSTLKRMAGEESEPIIAPSSSDKRFKDSQWEENNFFDFIKQMYLQTSTWAEDLVEDAEDLDDHTRHKAGFYVKQISNAMAPSNFVLTNPELLRETMSSNGSNLAKGMKLLAEDIKAGHGDLRIRQTDPDKFQVGVNVAVTPGKIVEQNDVCQLIQYSPTTEDVLKRPLLIVPPWINKYYILDLNQEKSFIKWAVEQGHTVFVISWINPDEKQADKSFEHYMREGILNSLDRIRKTTQQTTVNAIGYCVGGTLLATTLAYLAKIGEQDRIASATFLATQVDFTHAGDLKVFVDEEQIELLEHRMEQKGYLDGSKIATAFNMLRSNDLIWPYVVNNYLRGKEPFPFDLLYWNADSTRMPAANHSYYLRNCYQDNTLARGEMELAGEKLDLNQVEIPIYNLATKEDHIAPAKSVFKGCSCFGGPVEYVMSGSGHIAGVVNPPHLKKYKYWTGSKPEGSLEEWTQDASETPGSWWPHWQKWITSQDDNRVKARKPGARRTKIIEDAPGSYVKVRV
ncbi:Poly-beta-hydroxybutyrate polymerase [Pseudovibrio axinellae]|uniref:Poly-beta-hydroxybutyrate polymerase n=1 Tax=Pseudovibrio axinellae TaxID=989403 RepID=A0A165WMJ8_9HYPH|nr:class I poly(R)-hydroxyalkanoic acid synthase [Pseudovibrio axinellae]KZL16702.1 Poly-beta-hydroxybutyrate polymerase [Pseudovibrio axinellae]SEQ78154.1 polyhydroxyalkanoate synthase [Pseudovibrio axinellae]